jgi:hypothetical protein
MNNLIVRDDNYNLLVEQIRATITESVHSSRWILVEGYWGVGKLIKEDFKEDTTELLQGLAVDVGVSERTLWYSKRLYEKYPDINLLPEGKNITWNKLITKYLVDNPKEYTPPQITCPNCNFTFTKPK